MTPRFKWLVLVGDGVVAIGGLIVALILSPLWFTILLWKAHKQKLEMDMPNPHVNQLSGTVESEWNRFTPEGTDGPRNSSDNPPPTNYQA